MPNESSGVISRVAPSPTSSTAESGLLKRMQEVQRLMLEIHRLETEDGVDNAQCIREAHQRVIELSAVDNAEAQQRPDAGRELPPPYA